MTREEEINKFINKFLINLHGLKHGKDREYLNNTNEASLIKVGVEWADKHPKSPWISVKEDLPCNHEELIVGNLWTRETIVFNGDNYYFDRMSLIEGKWYWQRNTKVKYWMPIPNLPKE